LRVWAVFGSVTRSRVGDRFEDSEDNNDHGNQPFPRIPASGRPRRRLCAGGMGIGIVGTPSAAAAPDCSLAGVRATVASVTGSARQYLDGHPDANRAAVTASNQPHSQAAATLRDYFSMHPQECSDLRGILAPIDDAERQCHVTALPPNLESAYHQFMAG
jgi:heme-binding protein